MSKLFTMLRSSLLIKRLSTISMPSSSCIPAAVAFPPQLAHGNTTTDHSRSLVSRAASDKPPTLHTHSFMPNRDTINHSSLEYLSGYPYTILPPLPPAATQLTVDKLAFPAIHTSLMVEPAHIQTHPPRYHATYSSTTLNTYTQSPTPNHTNHIPSHSRTDTIPYQSPYDSYQAGRDHYTTK